MEVWSSFSHDPRDPRCASLRASDHDRTVVQAVLDEAYADGRLDRSEYDERTQGVGGVRHLGDVPGLLGDLVAPRPPTSRRSLAQASGSDLERIAQRTWQTKRRDAAFWFLGWSTVATAIWFATCFRNGTFEPYLFWPAFVIALSLLHLLRTAASRREIIESEVRRLEKRRERDQRKPGWLR
ncbi:DUF1707 SHOCT-like domain-containing protein [Nocardioides pyridinolyticus]